METLIKREIIKYYIDASSSNFKILKLMNPHLQTQEVKQLKILVETQLKITNEVLQEQIQNENQNNIDILKEIQKRQIKSVEKLNTLLGIRKEAGRL